MTIVDLIYHDEKGIVNAEVLLTKYPASTGHFRFLAEKNKIFVIKKMDSNAELIKDNVHYHFFSSETNFIQIHQFIKNLNPSIVIVHGFQNPFKIILLKLKTKAKIALQFHGGKRPNLYQFLMHIIADKCINAYFFTEKKQATTFINKGVIKSSKKIYEIMEGSNEFKKMSKTVAREILKIPNEKIFLWIGHLNTNKDPLIVLIGFIELLNTNDDLMLYMIYDKTNLLNEVKTIIANNECLINKVVLVGKVNQEKIELYCNCADYFVLGSHNEGSGYSLCEALACGCIPIVTDIPSFNMMTNKGKLGALWQVGDSNSFADAANICLQKNCETESKNCIDFFQKNLSHEGIATKALEHFNSIVNG